MPYSVFNHVSRKENVMKTVILLLSILISMQAFAKTTSIALTDDEKASTVALFNRLEVSAENKDPALPCRVYMAKINEVVREFNPALWTAQYTDKNGADQSIPLIQDEKNNIYEITFARDLFDRANVPTRHPVELVLEREAILKSKTCGMSPAQWTISFESDDEGQE